MLRSGTYALAACLLTACNTDEVQARAANKAQSLSEDVLDKAKGASESIAREVADEAAEGSKRAYEAGKTKAGELWNDVPDTGELSETAARWLDEHATKDSMAALVAKGQQVAPVALEIGGVLNDAVQSDTMLEPIYQPLDAEREAEFDAALEDMPRVEVMDGVQVGFRQMDVSSFHASVKERGYLVTWKRDDHLVGFIYRSKRTIDIDELVGETPRLLSLTKSALD